MNSCTSSLAIEGADAPLRRALSTCDEAPTQRNPAKVSPKIKRNLSQTARDFRRCIRMYTGLDKRYTNFVQWPVIFRHSFGVGLNEWHRAVLFGMLHVVSFSGSFACWRDEATKLKRVPQSTLRFELQRRQIKDCGHKEPAFPNTLPQRLQRESEPQATTSEAMPLMPRSIVMKGVVGCVPALQITHIGALQFQEGSGSMGWRLSTSTLTVCKAPST